MKTLNLVVAFLLAAVFLMGQRAAYAVSAAPADPCEVVGEIVEVRKINIAPEDVRDMCKGRVFDLYRIKLNIVSSSKIDEGNAASACDAVLQNADKTMSAIISGDMYSAHKIEPGKQIKAVVEFGGDECLHGLFVRSISDLE